MEGKFVLLVFASLFAAPEAKKTPVGPTYPYITTFKLKFNDETITDFVVESVYAARSAEFDESQHCNVSLYDVLKVIPFKKASPEVWDTALTNLNIHLDDDDVNAFISGLNYTLLQAMGFSMQTFYVDFARTYYFNSTDNLLRTLEILGIANEFSYAYAFGTDQDMFAAFQQGNFSQANLEEIGALLNVTVTFKDVLGLTGIKRSDSEFAEEFVNDYLFAFLEERGMERENLEGFLNAFGLTVGSYKRTKAFKTCYKSWTNNKTIGVAVSPNTIITNDNSLLTAYLRLQNYTILKVESLQNSKMEYVIEAANVEIDENGTIATITVDEEIPSFVSKVDEYVDLLEKNCTYVACDGKKLAPLNTTVQIVDNALAILKANDTLFTLSGPLVCEGNLYGLAAVNNTDTIVFETFGPIVSNELIDLSETTVANQSTETNEPTVSNEPTDESEPIDSIDTVEPNNDAKTNAPTGSNVPETFQTWFANIMSGIFG